MTYEEISKKYPVGSVYEKGCSTYTFGGYWATQADLEVLKDRLARGVYSELKIKEPKENEPMGTYEAIVKKPYECKVEGWIFNGTEWYVGRIEGYDWVICDHLD